MKKLATEPSRKKPAGARGSSQSYGTLDFLINYLNLTMNAAPDSSRNRQSPLGNRQFFVRVYAVVRTIPRGKVLTYCQIATLLGSPYLARQVGWAMHGCPKGLPWQRVVGAGGKILINSLSVGDGALLQRRLLELEGVRFAGQRIDMAEHQFVPSEMKQMGKKRTTGRKGSTKLDRQRVKKRTTRG